MDRRIWFVAVAVLLLMCGCDSPESVSNPPLTTSGVYILNEGLYQANNAEISFYDPASGTVFPNLFTTANPGQGLGDIANDIQSVQGKLFIVMNNSQKVEVISVGTNKKIASIATTRSPRQICVISSSKAYVTNMDSTVSVLDLASWTEIRRITVGQYPEDVLYSNGKVFVLNSGFGTGNTISVLSTEGDTVVATIPTPYGPAYGVTGTDGILYVSCKGYSEYGHPEKDTPGALIAIDPVSLAIVDSVSIQGQPGKLAIDTSNTLYVIGALTTGVPTVWKIARDQKFSIVSSALVSGTYYGIGVHSGRGELYLADAGDYVTPGRVDIHTLNGMLVRSLKSGIGVAPNGFAFVP